MHEDGSKILDAEIIQLLKYYRQDPFFQIEGGSKILSKYLRRDHGIIVNHKKIFRLCKENNLLLKKRGKKKSKFKKISKNQEVVRKNQIWELDIKYGYIHEQKKFFFLLCYIDVFTRKIVGWYVGTSCKGRDLLSTFKLALKDQNIAQDDGLTIRSDNGSQMTSDVFEKGIEDLPVDHEFIPVKTPNKNAHIESFFSIYDRYLQEQYFTSLDQAYGFSLEFIRFYNEYRIHGSLGMSPDDFTKREDIHHLEKFKQAI